MEVFDDWRYRWSKLCKNAGRWHVVEHWRTEDGWPAGMPVIRPLRRWSPRDLIRLPLHLWWGRKYW